MEKSYRRAISAWILRVLLLLGALILVALGSIYVYLQRDPQHLVDKWLKPISVKTGLQFEIGSINVTLLPLPAIAVGDVRITGPQMKFRVAWAQARPSFLELLHGNLFPGTIQVLRGRLSLTTDHPLNSPAALQDYFQNLFPASSGSHDLSLPGNFRLEVDQFDARIRSSDGSSIWLSNLQTTLDIEKNGNLGGMVHISALRIHENQHTLLGSLERFQTSGHANIHNFANGLLNLKAEGIIRWVNVLAPTRVQLALENFLVGWRGRAQVAGNLDVEGKSVPFCLETTASMPKNESTIALPNLQWRIGADSGTSELELALPGPKGDWHVAGKFTANRLSLTEWLGFARNLAPGLQIALDNITTASMDFSLGPKSLKATNIRATSSGATFTGTGGVENFAKPVVALNLKSADVNLALGLPESVAITPDAPFFPHPPLTPMPGEPLKPGETGIGYDIRLGATLLRYGPLKIRHASLRIYPGKMDRSGLEDVLLDAQAQFYGGTITGACILGADKSLPLHITGRAKGVNGATLSKDMPILPFRQGKWDANAVVASRGKVLAKFLANLAGNIAVTATNATLAATGQKNVFQNLKTSLKLRSASWASKHFSMDGTWNANVDTPQWDGNGTLTGKISFGQDGMTFRQLPGNLSLTLAKSPLPQGSPIKISGKISGQSDSGIYELGQGTITVPGLSVQTSAKVNAGKMQASGTISTNVADLGATLAKLGYRGITMPSQFNQLKIAAEYNATQDNVKLQKIKGSLGKVPLEGSFGVNLKNARPALDMDISLGEFPTLTFKPSTATPNRDFPILRQFDAKGKIRIRSIRIWDTHFLNTSIPFNLENGRLAVTKLSANFYGAPLEASGHANFQKGLVFDSDIRVNAFDLAKAVQDRKLGVKLSGSASFNAQTRGNLTGNAPLVNNLDGKWQFAIRNGGWQSLDNRGAPKGRSIEFKNASASGTLQKSIIRSNDFWLSGPGLTVGGGGSINLQKQDIKCEFNVSMKGLPDFPLTLSGPISNMKTSIGAGKLILNAVGEVASGFVDAIGGVLKGAWNIFRR